MSFSLGPGGGIQDPEMLRLLAGLTALVKENKNKGGASSPAVVTYIEKHKDVVFVDTKSQCMHTFKEVAVAMALLIQGIKNPDMIPGDGWQFGSSDRIFKEKDPDEPADWWKD